MKTINEYLEEKREMQRIGARGGVDGRLVRRMTPRLTCKDGFSMSVQVGDGKYCSPRKDGATHYTAAEIGFPSEAEPLIMEWVEDADDPTGTVYGYVPITVIDAVIAKHGGFADE